MADSTDGTTVTEGQQAFPELIHQQYEFVTAFHECAHIMAAWSLGLDHGGVWITPDRTTFETTGCGGALITADLRPPDLQDVAEALCAGPAGETVALERLRYDQKNHPHLFERAYGQHAKTDDAHLKALRDQFGAHAINEERATRDALERVNDPWLSYALLGLVETLLEQTAELRRPRHSDHEVWMKYLDPEQVGVTLTHFWNEAVSGGPVILTQTPTPPSHAPPGHRLLSVRDLPHARGSGGIVR